MTIRSVLVATDLDAPSLAAAEWAIAHLAPDAMVTLAHVVDPPPRPAFSDFLLPPAVDVVSVASEYASAKLRNVVTSRLIGARTEVRIGKPHEEIAALARELQVDLVVIGPHGDRPRAAKFLGTTAERIVRTSPVPVLVGTNPPQDKPRRLLVPVDDARVTPLLLQWARTLAEQFDADVQLLHVWSNAIYSHVASMSHATSANEIEARSEVEAELRDAAHHWLEQIARTGIARERVDATVTYGDPGDRTLEVAARWNADLILLGRRRASLVGPALLGSTVNAVLHGARRPVLVIPEPATADQN